MHTRGSRFTALIRARWLEAVSQNFPSRKMYDMITPTGQPSLFDQMNVHSFCASSISCFVVVIEAVDRDVFVVVDWFAHASHGTTATSAPTMRTANHPAPPRRGRRIEVGQWWACLTRAMATPDPSTIDDIPTPALVVEQSVFEANLAAMDAVRPGTELRPHVKAFKSTAMAARLAADGHTAFCCATPREVEGLVHAGLGHDVLLANESLDVARLGALAARDDLEANITVADRLRCHARRCDRGRRAFGAGRRRRRTTALRLRPRRMPADSPTGPVLPASTSAA